MKVMLKIEKDIHLEAELNNSETAQKIYQSLPLKGQGSTWGQEIYFSVPVEVPLEADARDVLEIGELGYWPDMNAFCIFYGPTPASRGDEIRAAGPVNVFGKILDDITPLKELSGTMTVVVESRKN